MAFRKGALFYEFTDVYKRQAGISAIICVATKDHILLALGIIVLCACLISVSYTHLDGLLPYSKEIDRCATEGGMFKAITYCNTTYTASLNKVLEILEQMELAEQSEDDAAYECEEDADE